MWHDTGPAAAFTHSHRGETVRPSLTQALYALRILAVFVLAAIVLLSGVMRLGAEITECQTAPAIDPITANENRYAPVRAAISAGDRAGYIADGLTLPGVWPMASPRAAQGYYLAQYALAPALIFIPSDAPLVVGNFSSVAAAKEFAAQHLATLSLVSLGRGGVALFRRGAQ